MFYLRTLLEYERVFHKFQRKLLTQKSLGTSLKYSLQKCHQKLNDPVWLDYWKNFHKCCVQFVKFSGLKIYGVATFARLPLINNNFDLERSFLIFFVEFKCQDQKFLQRQKQFLPCYFWNEPHLYSQRLGVHNWWHL